MDLKKKTAFGIYKTESEAWAGVNALHRAGFSGYEMSMMTSEGKAPDTGTAEGAAVGALIGGFVGIFVGLGAIAIPGIVPLIVAGPVMGTLSCALIGGLIGAFVGHRRPDGGKVLMAVHIETAGDMERAVGELERTGATEITTNTVFQNEARASS